MGSRVMSMPDALALGIDVGKAGLDLRGRHVRGDVEQNVGVIVGFHLGVDGTRHHVARGQVLPLGGIFLHERAALRG